MEPDLSAIRDARKPRSTWHSRNCVAHSLATPIIGRHGDDPASLGRSRLTRSSNCRRSHMSGKHPRSASPAARNGTRPIRPFPGVSRRAMRAKLERIVSRVPEVMVKITGRTKGVAHLKSHLAYITRNGELDTETEQGAAMTGRSRIEGPAATAGRTMLVLDDKRRRDGSLSINIILSMPAGTDGGCGQGFGAGVCDRNVRVQSRLRLRPAPRRQTPPRPSDRSVFGP